MGAAIYGSDIVRADYVWLVVKTTSRTLMMS